MSHSSSNHHNLRHWNRGREHNALMSEKRTVNHVKRDMSDYNTCLLRCFCHLLLPPPRKNRFLVASLTDALITETIKGRIHSFIKLLGLMPLDNIQSIASRPHKSCPLAGKLFFRSSNTPVLHSTILKQFIRPCRNTKSEILKIILDNVVITITLHIFVPL